LRGCSLSSAILLSGDSLITYRTHSSFLLPFFDGVVQNGRSSLAFFLKENLQVHTCFRDGVAQERTKAFPLWWIAGENLIHIATWLVAGWLLWPVRWLGCPVASLGWAALVLVVQVLLKKHNCSGCYYYGRLCHLGWGKLSAWLFEQDSGSAVVGKRLSLFYVMSPPVILVSALTIGVLAPVSAVHWILLAVYVALNAITFPVRRQGCQRCAMRDVCPGSACRNGS
jgi:hypothetical protein